MWFLKLLFEGAFCRLNFKGEYCTDFFVVVEGRPSLLGVKNRKRVRKLFSSFCIAYPTFLKVNFSSNLDCWTCLAITADRAEATACTRGACVRGAARIEFIFKSQLWQFYTVSGSERRHAREETIAACGG